ncbi:MAG: hypothetical protein ACRDDI_13400 [Aeromonas veronii]
MIKAIPSAFDRVRDLAHRGQRIRNMMSRPDCDPLVLELLEREALRNDKMAHEALQDAIYHEGPSQWAPKPRSFSDILRTGPSIMEIVNNVPRVVISNIPTVSFGEALARELEQSGKATASAAGLCDECERREGCQPAAEEFETAITIDTKAASVDELWDAVVNIQVELFRRGAANR